MTVSTTIIKNFHNGNASTTNFAYQFRILEDTDLLVIIRTNSTGAEATKTLSTHYTVAGAGDASGGSITFTAGNVPASGETVVIRRNVPQTQAIDYIANDPFPAETHEEGLDRGTMVAQQVAEESDRSIKLSRTNTMTSTEFTVGATDRANKVLSFDANGEIAVTQELGTYKGTSATTTTAAYAIRDIVKGSTTAQLNNIYICIQASPIGTALTNTAYWTLIVDAVSAAASAATATTKASEAAASATAAGNSETAAETAESNAETAEAAAETAQAAAEAAFDSFDDRYLGAKSSAPSTDNDGNALLTGALYFNSSSNIMFNWTSGDAWESLKPSSSEQTNINALSASAVIADMAILATDAIVADMAILGTDAIVADMAILGTDAVVADMAILGTDALVADMAILGSNEIVADMALLGTSANVTAMGLLGVSAVITDMGILGTAAIVEDMALLGTSANVSAMDVIGTSTVVANIATVAANVAGVNSFAARYRVGSSNPTSDLDEGDLFYNTTSNVVLFYNGSNWITIVAGNVTQTGVETLTNKTLTAPKINENVVLTSTATELNLLDGKAATNLALLGKTGGTNFTNSLLVGHATTGTLNSANENVGIGTTALDAITSGDNNVAIGMYSGTNINSGIDNTLVGHSAGGALTSTGKNTFIGAAAGASSNAGDRNTCIGHFSGQNITSADGCVFIGSSMTADSQTDNRQLKIGGNDGSTTTTWISGDSSGNLVTPGTITANSVVLTGVAADNSITLAKMASGTDGNLITYDTSGNPAYVATGNAGQILTSAGAGAVPTFADAGGGGLTEADSWRLTADVTSDGDITSNLERDDTYGNGNLGTGMSVSSGIFTFPSTGYYLVTAFVRGEATGGDLDQRLDINVTTDNSSYNAAARCNWDGYEGPNAVISNSSTSKLLDVTNTSNVKVKFTASAFGGYTKALGSTSINYTHFNFLKVGDT
jgi:UDP-3-O-[3-hydroxymyristoyl] glucosamine N-acyltransferase